MKVRQNVRCQLTTGGLLLRLQCMLGAPIHPCKIFCFCFPTWLCHNRFHLYLEWPRWPSKWFILYNSLVVSYGWKLVWLVCFLVPIQTTWCSPEFAFCLTRVIKVRSVHSWWKSKRMLATYMRRMRNNILEIRIAGDKRSPQLIMYTYACGCTCLRQTYIRH